MYIIYHAVWYLNRKAYLLWIASNKQPLLNDSVAFYITLSLTNFNQYSLDNLKNFETYFKHWILL